jgi:hypothetical protein
MKFIPYAVIYGKCQPKNILANTWNHKYASHRGPKKT